ncbi:HINT domain-containing protein [Aeoliella sp. ICT_H6.2]|uniref:HINT domain-containing protein n=1 Tax=Aeoliella straminimaris TaxID=2954799 RepID=A0A9X2FGX4_9BACT|nr:polymorphic toxin-type HINT domain-containing protein [Aeoliella straminimaris]MCO6044161.1 HINT domain-containing protein [Aeoliella straminimaris]
MRTRLFASAILFLGVTATCFAGDDSVTTGLANRMTREALAAGAAGDMDLREQLLDQVLRVAPEHAPAHWARGEMQVSGQWKPIVAVQDEASDNQLLDKYQQLRRTASSTPDDQFQLARWCERNDLQDEARYHWLQVLAVDRDNRQALRALDSQWVGGQLLPRDEAEEIIDEQRNLRKVNADWRTRIAGWQRALAAGSDEAARALAEVEAVVDESAILEFEKLAAKQRGQYPAEAERSASLCKAFVSALSRLPSYEASLSMARLAVLADDASLREVAAETLKLRPTYEVVPVLITGLSPLIESRFEITRSENGRVSYSHQFVAEGADTDFVAEASTTVSAPVIVQAGSRGTDVRRAVARSRQRTTSAAQRMYREAMRLEQQAQAANTSREQLNERIVATLRTVTDKDFGNDPAPWWDYWREENGYDESRETVAYRTSQSYDMPVVTELPPSGGGGGRCECFAAGTLVWTKTGMQAIETLTAGDLVLTMDERTGERCFRPVLDTTIRDPSPLMHIATEGYQVLATPGHPFWVEGTGWRMAKELEPGDRVLSAHGAPIEIRAVASSDVDEQAYNLVVEGNNNYFVGQEGLLSHDNTQRRPELARAGKW